jgi:hypothetical protein
MLESDSGPIAFRPGLVSVKGSPHDIVQVEIDNSPRDGLRLSDDEARLISLDDAVATLYRWLDDPDLTYEDMTDGDGIVLRGYIRKLGHNETIWAGEILPLGLALMPEMPTQWVNLSAWPDAAEAAQGAAYPIPFGNFGATGTSCIPLIYVDNAGFQFLLSWGAADVVQAYYTAATLKVKTRDGSVVAPALYAVGLGSDGQGQPCTLFNFIDAPPSEELYCSARGLTYQGALVQSFASVTQCYLSLAGFQGSQIDVSRVGFNAWKLAALIKEPADGWDILQRLMGKPNHLPFGPIVAHPSWRGKLTLFMMDLNSSVVVASLREGIEILDVEGVGRTDQGWLVNDVRLNYNYDYGRGAYHGQIILNRLNSPLCRASYGYHGRTSTLRLDCHFLAQQASAIAYANWLASFGAFRHDVLRVKVPVELSYLEPGQIVAVTHGLGPSRDGVGWVEEPFIILPSPMPEIGLYDCWLTLMRVVAP